MKRCRHVVFWLHLTAGVTAGAIVLIMSTSGALLVFPLFGLCGLCVQRDLF